MSIYKHETMVDKILQNSSYMQIAPVHILDLDFRFFKLKDKKNVPQILYMLFLNHYSIYTFDLLRTKYLVCFYLILNIFSKIKMVNIIDKNQK